MRVGLCVFIRVVCVCFDTCVLVCVCFDTCVLQLCIDISKITQMTQKTLYCTAICVRRHVLQVVAACRATRASTNRRLKRNVCMDVCTSHTLLHEFTQCMSELVKANQVRLINPTVGDDYIRNL